MTSKPNTNFKQQPTLSFLKKVFNVVFTPEFLILFFTLIASFAVRILAFPYISGDYSAFLTHWWKSFEDLGLDKAYGVKIADYFYPYIYLLGFATLFPIKDLFAIKFISIFFDYLLAFLLYRFVLKIQPVQKFKAIVTGVLFLFLPTVISNGAVWGQCDVIYTFFSVLSLFLFIKKDNYWASFSFAIAFCFKLQAIFILPLVIFILWKRGAKQLLNLLLIPLLYMFFSIPGILQGRDFREILTIYGSQAGSYPGVNYGGFGLYSLFTGNEAFGELKYKFFTLDGEGVLYTTTVNNMIGAIGTLVAATVVCVLFFSLVKYVKNLTNSLIINCGFAFAFIVPYFLPRMHERYWFLADVLSFLYVMLNPKRWYVCVIAIMLSFASYSGFLFQGLVSEMLPSKWLPFIAIVPMYFVIKDIIDEIKLQHKQDKKVEKTLQPDQTSINSLAAEY